MDTPDDDGRRVTGTAAPAAMLRRAPIAAARRGLALYLSAAHVRLGLIMAAAVLFVDQASKAALLYGLGLKEFVPGQHIEILPFFDLVMVWNEGVSFGLLPGGGALAQVVLTIFALAVVGLLGVWLYSARRGMLAIGIGSVIGGAIGNAIDRVVYGAVADFFDAHAFGHHWYIFNVADAFIVLGVGLLIYDTLTAGRTAGKPQERRGENHG